MKFVSFRFEGQTGAGLLLDAARVLDLRALDARYTALAAFIADGSPALEKAKAALAGPSAEWIRPLSGLVLTAPIGRPAKNVFCVGRNYRAHVAEGARALGLETDFPKAPQFFTKPPTAVIGPGEDIRLDSRVTQQLDYEIELGVVIGKPGRDIPAEHAFDHVFGYTIVNDVTARDLQRLHGQWFKGKGLDTTCPMGPSFVTRDEVPDVTALELSLTVNGEKRQSARVADMIFDIPRIIAWLSQGLTLEPGDVIATGTPEGVGFAMTPPQILKGGDVVACTITGLGTLTNRIREVS